ncbi:hypothetical protein GFS60_06512 (plasmid) [Rhodococcus sp. WAY2]|nr:hypothetical protein GFS60_06512 [Rhodococcus sp. WAY2]
MGEDITVAVLDTQATGWAAINQERLAGRVRVARLPRLADDLHDHPGRYPDRGAVPARPRRTRRDTGRTGTPPDIIIDAAGALADRG